MQKAASNTREAIELLYEANRTGLWLWMSDGELRYKAPKDLNVSELLVKLRRFKGEVLEILRLNNVTSEKIRTPFIYRVNDHRCQLSFAQERLWFVEKYENGSNAYHAPAVYELNHDTHIDNLKSAFCRIVERHEVLRTVIVQTDEGAVQVVRDECLKIEEAFFNESDDYEAAIKADIHRPFDLSLDFPIRVKLYYIQPAKNSSGQSLKVLLLINIHHIANDGWSLDIFQRELVYFYRMNVELEQNVLPQLSVQYKDYAVWQRNFLKDNILSSQLSYWKKKLSGYQPLHFPTDFVRPPEKDYGGKTHTFKIDKNITRALRALAKQNNASLNSVMLGSAAVLLSKYTGQSDIIIGSPTANRNNEQVENLIGFFINTIANRIILNDNESFEDLIKRIQDDQTESQAYCDLPLEMIINEMALERDSSRHPIFQVLFGVQSFGKDWVKTPDDLFTPFFIEDAYEVSKFDFTIYIDDSSEELNGMIIYSTSLFKDKTIHNFVSRYLYFLGQITRKPKALYDSVELITDSEKEELILIRNNTDVEYPDKTLAQLFEEQVAKTPDAIALKLNDLQLTYRELNQRCNQLANHIQAEYVKLNMEIRVGRTVIALFMDRSVEMIVSILAVLKVGAAYVGIDIGYPEERIRFIIEDAGADFIITKKKLDRRSLAKLPSAKIIYADLQEEIFQKNSIERSAITYSGSDWAYLIYTSGTTGRPKGVITNHRAIVSKIYGLIDNHCIDSSIVVGCKIPYIFDPSLREIFVGLLSGGKLILISDEMNRNPRQLIQCCLREKINLLTFVPSHLGVFLDEARNHPDLSNLKRNLRFIYSCGERFNVSLAKDIKSVLPGVSVKNQYGPSEVSQVSFEYEVNNFTNSDNHIPLGLQAGNAKAYVLDNKLRIVPEGIVGELYLSGTGVTQGYLNLDELTRQKFIKNPFVTEPNKNKGLDTMYKTGDLVRWSSDGYLEYIGRNDDQVKIRGFRVELGEIETKLMHILGIKQSCVLYRKISSDSQNAQLIAYCVLDSTGTILTEDDIKLQISALLPEYMVPDFVVVMDAFPLTANGKINRSVLPEPEMRKSCADSEKPLSDLERNICNIWISVLGLKTVGVTDSFFKIGGNSILAIQVCHRINKDLFLNVKVADLFRAKTVKNLVGYLSVPEKWNIEPVRGTSAVLSYAQERLWFVEEYEQGTSVYHFPDVYELHEHASSEAIKYAIGKIISRHEVFRTTIRQNPEEGHAVQDVNDWPFVIDNVKCGNLEAFKKLVIADLNRPFKLDREYPVRVMFYEVADESGDEGKYKKRFLSLNIHHIAYDGWSIDIFHAELRKYYDAYVRGDLAFSLRPLDIQYKDYAVWQRKLLTGEILDSQVLYWKKKLSGFQPCELPADFKRPASVDYKGDFCAFSLDTEISKNLRRITREWDTSLNSLMLSAFYVLLNKYTGSKDIVIGSVNANRHHFQTEKIIGFFVNTLVNRALINTNDSFIDFAKNIHDDLIDTHQNLDLPFERLLDELKITRDPSRHPIFQIMFGVQSFGSNAPEAILEDTVLKPYHLNEIYQTEKFDLSIRINDGGDILQGYISYATSLYRKETIERFILHYTRIIQQIVSAPATRISEIKLLNNDEFNQIVFDWNSTRDFDGNFTVHQLFEKAAQTFPDNVALDFGNINISYRELNKKSNQLAHYLRARYSELKNCELSADTLIAIYTDRSVETVIGILGILKAGAAFVPIDVSYPTDRIRYMINDSRAPFILTREPDSEGLPLEFKDKVIIIDSSQPWYKEQPAGELACQSHPENLAYIIYTSGTTGIPKGVMQTHKNVVRLFAATREIFDFSATDVWTLFHSYAFDFSVWEMWGALFHGGKLLVVPNELAKDTNEFFDFCVQKQVTILNQTPSAFYRFADVCIQSGIAIQSLRYVIFGGEALNIFYLNDWWEYHSQQSLRAKLINMYGITETTVHVTFKEITKSETATSNIGKGIPDMKLYVLDEYLYPVPVGVTGELYVGGYGLAKGYLNRDDLTISRFISNPFATAAERKGGLDRLYRSGDLVRWLPSGDLDYIGRNDEQIKLRGYRIEIGEIEHALDSIDQIKNSCVLMKDSFRGGENVQFLVAYYMLKNHLSVASIRHKLGERLPEYMIPAHFVQLDEFPLTNNGKLDKNKLPLPDFNITEPDFAEPLNESEEKACTIWQEVLGIKKVGVTDDFFQIGGNSILAVRISYLMKRAVGYNVRVADIFRFKNIRSILSNKAENDFVLIKRLTNIKEDFKNIFFIHPGSAGCEVYQNLADSLYGNFNCYGVDNYNIHTEAKIKDIEGLSGMYYNAIIPYYTKHDEINLVGWSLGGRIALEISAILEKNEYKKINVILLDTRIPDPKSDELFRGLDIDAFSVDFKNFMLSSGYENQYVEKVISCLETDYTLSNAPVRFGLKHTQVVLFKAIEKNIILNNTVFDALHKYYLNIQYNNVDKVVKNIEVREVSCHHSEILEKYGNQVADFFLSANKELLKS